METYLTSSKEINQHKVFKRQTNFSFHEKNPQPLASFYTHAEKAFKKLFFKADDSLKVLMNYFVDYSERYPELFMSQSRISQDTGIPLSTVERKLNQLRDLGFISSNYRHMNTCEYKVSSYFKIPSIVKKIVRFFPALVDRFLHIEGHSNIIRIYNKAGNQLINIDNVTVHKLPTEIVKAAGIFAGAREGELQKKKEQPKRGRESMEINLKSKHLIDQVRKLTGRTLTNDEASQLLVYNEADIEQAIDILGQRVSVGTIIGNAFRYLSQILTSPKPAYKKREQAPSGANKTAQQENKKPLSPYSNESLNEKISLTGQISMRELLYGNKLPSNNAGIREGLRRDDAIGNALRKILRNSIPSSIPTNQLDEENCLIEAQKIYILSREPEMIEKLKQMDANEATASFGTKYMNQVIANWMNKARDFKQAREEKEKERETELDEAYTEQECNIESMRVLVEGI